MEAAVPIGEQLKASREAAGLTQTELARKAGLTQSAISEIESGKRRRPSWETIHKIQTALASA